jgi:ABC-type uncharacterized transport system substrate-binding protein
VRRREFITLLGGAAAIWPLAAQAQQAGRIWRIGFLFGAIPAAQFASEGRGFTEGMRQLGYLEGKDFVIEWRSAEGQYARLPDLAAELVRLQVDVIVLGSPPTIRPVQQATRTIPIVMGYSTDPVGNGLVASLAHPGGNTTGLAGSSDVSSALIMRVQAAAKQTGLLLVPVEARTPQEIENAFAGLAKQSLRALIVGGDPMFFTQRKRLTQLALNNRMASIFSLSEYAVAGGLMSYGEDLQGFYRRAASFVDKILKGAKPGDLPIKQPTRFNLVINRKTADALGLTIPPELYIFADEVIE